MNLSLKIWRKAEDLSNSPMWFLHHIIERGKVYATSPPIVNQYRKGGLTCWHLFSKVFLAVFLATKKKMLPIQSRKHVLCWEGVSIKITPIRIRYIPSIRILIGTLIYFKQASNNTNWRHLYKRSKRSLLEKFSVFRFPFSFYRFGVWRYSRASCEALRISWSSYIRSR